MKDQEYNYFYQNTGDTKYCYPGSNVLINKFDCKDLTELRLLERDLVSLREADLYVSGFEGDFSLNHLCKIHKYLFQDVYEWAGKIRTVDISKGTIFCLVQFIEMQFEELHVQLKSENFLQDISDKEILADRLSYYLGEINMIHPFREGNGRSQRCYLTLLCEKNSSFELNFQFCSRDEMLEASMLSANGDNSGLKKLIFSALKEKQ